MKLCHSLRKKIWTSLSWNTKVELPELIYHSFAMDACALEHGIGSFSVASDCTIVQGIIPDYDM